MSCYKLVLVISTLGRIQGEIHGGKGIEGDETGKLGGGNASPPMSRLARTGWALRTEGQRGFGMHHDEK